jgi:hypothetical protein
MSKKKKNILENGNHYKAGTSFQHAFASVEGIGGDKCTSLTFVLEENIRNFHKQRMDNWNYGKRQRIVE